MERQKKIYFKIKEDKDIIDNLDIARLAKIVYDLDIDPYDYDKIRDISESFKGVVGELENPSPELLLRSGNTHKATVLYRDLNNTDYKTAKEAINKMMNNIAKENMATFVSIQLEAPHLLTNFYKTEREIYEKAIAEYGDNNIKIHEEAYDKYGHVLEDCLSLHYYGHKSRLLDEFWVIQDRIEREMK